MAEVSGNPLRASTASEADPLDDEWERFQANGCPDWWLLAKYVGQAAARSFPYSRSMSVAGSPPGGTAVPRPASADAPPEESSYSRRAASADGCSLTTAAAASKHSAAAEGNMLELQQQQGQQQAVHHRAPPPPHAAAAVPDALSTSPTRSVSGAGGAAGAGAPTSCGLKGLFACTGGCTPPCPAGAAADQQG